MVSILYNPFGKESPSGMCVEFDGEKTFHKNILKHILKKETWTDSRDPRWMTEVMTVCFGGSLDSNINLFVAYSYKKIY
jgi:hypothetical protein